MPDSDTPPQTDDQLTISVATSRGKADFTFSKTTKVEEVINKIRDHFGLTDGDFDLLPEGGDDALNEDRPLVSFGIEDGDEFILTGGGTNV